MRIWKRCLLSAVLLGVSSVALAQNQTTASFSPSFARPGSTVEFTWRGYAGATRCRIFGVPGLESSLQVSGRIGFGATQNLNATVLCTGSPPVFDPLRQATAQFTLDNSGLQPPVVDAFYSFVPQTRTRVDLVYFSARANFCNIRDNFGLNIDVAPFGSIPVGFVPGFFMNTVSCFGPGGSVSMTVSTFAAAGQATTGSTALDPATATAANDQNFREEHDLDGDGQAEIVVFDAKRQRLHIEALGANGRFEVAKAVEGIRNLRQLRGIEITHTPDGVRQIQILTQP